MGSFYSTPPPPPQPVVVQTGPPGAQTTVVYAAPNPGYGPGGGPGLGLVGDLLVIGTVADIATDIALIDAISGGSKKQNKKNKNTDK